MTAIQEKLQHQLSHRHTKDELVQLNVMKGLLSSFFFFLITSSCLTVI